TSSKRDWSSDVCSSDLGGISVRKLFDSRADATDMASSAPSTAGESPRRPVEKPSSTPAAAPKRGGLPLELEFGTIAITEGHARLDRKSTRLNSSHVSIS